MIPAILGLAVVLVTAVTLAALSVSRRLSRVKQATGAAVVPPVRSQPSGGDGGASATGDDRAVRL